MDITQRFELAVQKQQQGDLSAAEQNYLAVLQALPEHVESHYNLASLYAQLTQWQSAIAHYRLALSHCPQQPMIQYNLSITLLNTDTGFGEAVYLLQQVVLFMPDHLDARHLLACTLMSAGNYEQAKPHFLAYIAQKNDDAQAYYNLGVLSLYEQNTTKAQAYFEQAIHYQVNFPEAYYNLGIIAAHQEATSRAIDYFKQTLLQDEQYFAAHYQLVLQYKNNNETQQAISHCQQALLLQPNNPSLSYLLAVLTQSQTLDCAPDDYIVTLFDSYAAYYDQHVVKDLSYQLPQQLRRVFEASVFSENNLPARVLDVGCGTGLSGAFFRDKAARLIGVDLSARMIGIARGKHLYDELHQSNGLRFLTKQVELFDIILFADTFVYSGDLQAMIVECARLLSDEGRLVFNVEQADCGYQLLSSGRFAHSDDYIKSVLESCQLFVYQQESAIIRTQENDAIVGLLYSVGKKK